jgi:hypothetical protein
MDETSELRFKESTQGIFDKDISLTCAIFRNHFDNVSLMVSRSTLEPHPFISSTGFGTHWYKLQGRPVNMLRRSQVPAHPDIILAYA